MRRAKEGCGYYFTKKKRSGVKDQREFPPVHLCVFNYLVFGGKGFTFIYALFITPSGFTVINGYNLRCDIYAFRIQYLLFAFSILFIGGALRANKRRPNRSSAFLFLTNLVTGRQARFPGCSQVEYLLTMMGFISEKAHVPIYGIMCFCCPIQKNCNKNERIAAELVHISIFHIFKICTLFLNAICAKSEIAYKLTNKSAREQLIHQRYFCSCIASYFWDILYFC